MRRRRRKRWILRRGGIDVTALEAEARTIPAACCRIEHYRCGLSLSDIREKTTIDREFVPHARPSIADHPMSGGVSGADSGLHTKAYERVSPRRDRSRLVGAFTQLLGRHENSSN